MFGESNYYLLSILYSNNNNIEFIGQHDNYVKRDNNILCKDFVLYYNKKDHKINIINFLKNALFDISIAIDYRFIRDKEIIDILKMKKVKAIRVIGEDYILTKDDYESLSFAKQIIVNSKGDISSDKIIEQNNIFKKEYKKSKCNEVTYFIDRVLSPLEISYLVLDIKKTMKTYGLRINTLISFRFYDPKVYKKILNQLKKYNLPSDIKIQFICNPLNNEIEEITSLLGAIDNEIDIIYNSSKYLVKKYGNEPFTRYNFYHNESECGDICSLKEYFELLTILGEYSNHIEKMEYSPLETLVYGYRFLHHNYIYDESMQERKGIRKCLSTEKIINLYTLLMRKCGMPVFKYSTDEHVRVITRLIDDKYNVDKIGVIDPIWDSVYQNCFGNILNENSYTYFMLSPKDTLKFINPDCLTLAAILVLDEKTVKEYELLARSSFETDLDNTYSPLTNVFYILNLMGYDVKDWKNIFPVITDIQNNGTIDSIDSDLIKKAVTYIEQRENYNLSLFDKVKILRAFDLSLTKRRDGFVEDSKIQMLDYLGNPLLIELPDDKSYKK